MRKFTVVTLLVFLAACAKGREEPSASVPVDCHQFLDKYFGAWKSKSRKFFSELEPNEGAEWRSE